MTYANYAFRLLAMRSGDRAVLPVVDCIDLIEQRDASARCVRMFKAH